MDLNAPGSQDFSPNTDSTGAAWFTKIALETAWADFGALTHKINASGGGGGIFTPDTFSLGY